MGCEQVKIHQQLLSKQRSNLSDVHKLAFTPIKVDVLMKYLAGYPDQDIASFLYEGFKYGFKLCYEGPRQSVVFPNLKSIQSHEVEAINIILKEVELGRISGPYMQKPLQNLIASPVGIIPKKNGSSFHSSFVISGRCKYQ